MRVAHKPSDIPSVPHFAIMTFGTIHIPGDERSRTNPGHGYPAHTETKVTYYVCDNEEEWKREIHSRMTRKYGNKDFVAISAKRPDIQMKTIVDIST